MNTALRKGGGVALLFRGKEAMQKLTEKTISNERIHIAWLLIGAPATVYAVMLYWWGYAGALAITNLGINLYAIFIQRYNRARITASIK